MIFYDFFRISKPSKIKVKDTDAADTYKSLRAKTFWGATAAYCLFYVCRMAMSVVKQPIIDENILTPGQIGIIGSAMLFIYAIGKFVNGFLADYCNIRRFMATGLLLSALLNLIMGLLGLLKGFIGFSSAILLIVFSITWGINGWMQSMGAPPGVISLSRWFPLSKRGTYYSIFCATPYFGKFLSLIMTSHIVLLIGWQFGFIFSAIAGLAGAGIILIFVSDTPESKGLPSVQELSQEKSEKADSMPIKQLQMAVLKHPGIWIIALSSAFVYITQYAISNWGVLFLQKAKDYSLKDAAFIIGISETVGIIGTVFAGWLSDTVFKGNRLKPVMLCGIMCMCTLALFIFSSGGMVINIILLSLASLSIAAVYCIVAGLMALDIVPRKATGAALGVVGISSYIAAGIQDIISGYLIEGNMTEANGYNFTPVASFWLLACLISFLLPIISWKYMKPRVIE